MKAAIITLAFWLGIAVVIGQSLYSVVNISRCGVETDAFWEIYQIVLNGC